jgi:hypothetical protein
MATTTQFVAVTAINQQTQKPPPAGTATGTLVVPANAEATIRVQCAVSTAGASTTATFSAPAPYGNILNNTNTASSVLETTITLGPGTYTLTATSPGGVSTATVSLVGVLRTYT